MVLLLTQHNSKPYHVFTKGFALLSMAFMLSSCSHLAKKDGPPKYYVDETIVPNATPKPEPIARYGNMQSYVVFGKRYYVMKNSKNYDATGTASWYGTQFHEHRTSSGERYNMLGMTAAHKTLPLPTYVYVTNLKNKRSIIVKVNDRGPFESNRLIDLSYVAAKKLGMLGHGTANVRVQAIDGYEYAQSPTNYLARLEGRHIESTHFALPEPVNLQNIPSSTRYASSSNHRMGSGHYAAVTTAHYTPHVTSVTHHHSSERPVNSHQYVYLQAGAFQNQGNAHHLKQRLATLVSSPVNIAAPGAHSRLYRVQIGPFSSHTEAETVTHHLERLGIHTSRVSGA